MTTKEQERKALEQILDIITGLGADSYIGCAIDKNVIDRAKENIENDFGIMTGEVIAHAEEATRKAEQKVTEAKQEKKAAEYGEKLEAVSRLNHEHYEAWNTTISELEQERERAEAAEAEVIALKAKLYDYMTK